MKTELTAEDIAEMDQRIAEQNAIDEAIQIIQERARNDAEMLVLLNMGRGYSTAVGKYAHAAAFEAARAIKSEAS